MIAKQMKIVVKNSGKSQSAVAEMLGVSQPRLNQYLNGKREPDYSFVFKFCHYFNVTPNYLFDFNSGNLDEKSLDCFINILRIVENWASDHKMTYSPEGKSELIRLIFKKVYGLPEKQQESKILDFLDVYETMKKSL